MKFFAKSFVSDAWQGPVCAMFLVDKFLLGFHKTIWGTRSIIKAKSEEVQKQNFTLILISANLKRFKKRQ